MAARHVTYYDPDNYDMYTSERRYSQYQYMVVERVEDSDGWSYDRALNLTVYEDDETGLLTTDVGKFERWMQERG